MYIYLSCTFEKLETVSNFRAGTVLRILFSSSSSSSTTVSTEISTFHICTAKIEIMVVFISRSHQGDQTQDYSVN